MSIIATNVLPLQRLLNARAGVTYFYYSLAVIKRVCVRMSGTSVKRRWHFLLETQYTPRGVSCTAKIHLRHTMTYRRSPISCGLSYWALAHSSPLEDDCNQLVCSCDRCFDRCARVTNALFSCMATVCGRISCTVACFIRYLRNRRHGAWSLRRRQPLS